MKEDAGPGEKRNETETLTFYTQQCKAMVCKLPMLVEHYVTTEAPDVVDRFWDIL